MERMVAEGFEPSKRDAYDLESYPFDRTRECYQLITLPHIINIDLFLSSLSANLNLQLLPHIINIDFIFK